MWSNQQQASGQPQQQQQPVLVPGAFAAPQQHNPFHAQGSPVQAQQPHGGMSPHPVGAASSHGTLPSHSASATTPQFNGSGTAPWQGQQPQPPQQQNPFMQHRQVLQQTGQATAAQPAPFLGSGSGGASGHAFVPSPQVATHQPMYATFNASGTSNPSASASASHVPGHVLHGSTSSLSGVQQPQYMAMPQQQPQQQQQPPQQPQAQVVLLPNGQYALLQPTGISANAPPPGFVQPQQHQQQAPILPPQMHGQPMHPHHQHHQHHHQPHVATISPGSSMSRSLSQPVGGTPQMVQVTVGGAPSPTSAISPQRTTGLVSVSPGHSITSIPGRASGAPSPGGSTTVPPANRPLCDTATWGYAIVDPYHQALQRVPVPPSVVSPTRGVKAYVNDVSLSSTKPCTSIMCMRHIGAGGCPLGDTCHNFHVDASYVEAARACTDPLCCGLHNCYFTREMIKAGCAPHIASSKYTIVLEDRSEVEVMPSQLAWTIGLDQLSVRGAARVINLRKQVCRLHLEGRCKWTKDCGHVHLCRELHRFLVALHLPSLVFLLSTETDAEKLRMKLAEVSDFVKSRTCLPLTWHLIQSKRGAAVRCMADAGALFTLPMANAASKELDIDAPAAQVLPEADAATGIIAAAAVLGSSGNTNGSNGAGASSQETPVAPSAAGTGSGTTEAVVGSAAVTPPSAPPAAVGTAGTETPPPPAFGVPLLPTPPQSALPTTQATSTPPAPQEAVGAPGAA